MEAAVKLIESHDWSPRILPRRNGREYLYAERRFGTKVKWRYIGPITKVEEMTRETILSKLITE